MYKVIHGLVTITSVYLIPHGRITRSTHLYFSTDSNHKNVYKYSLFLLTIVKWNRLPGSVVSLPGFDLFKLEEGKLNYLRP